MYCRAYCTASSYEIKALYDCLRVQGAIFYRDAVHLHISNYEAEVSDVFFFSYGVMVCLGLTLDQCQTCLDQVRPYEENPLTIDEVEIDEFYFSFGDVQKIVDDEIILADSEVLTRLAFSHAIAQSVKLGTFENAMRRIFNHTKNLPEELEKYGKISLSRKVIRRKMGELFIARNSINLHLDVLDTPEFFWENPEVEPLYTMIAMHLDIKTRVEVLNQRLVVIKELFEMLGNELNHQHSSRLEWTIIWLIIIEVSVSFLRDVFRVI